ncbi:MAG: phage tail protein, partial [Patescibacteria group bacterium]|nr:phage tail protein [Patescibacteria group bacterium]
LPQKIRRTNEFNYAEIPVIGSKPVMQWTYDHLQELHLELLFHYFFTNPQAAENALLALAATHKAQQLTFGNGDNGAGTNMGLFVIKKLERDDIWRADDGSIIALSMKMDLVEYDQNLPVNAPLDVPTNTPGVVAQNTELAQALVNQSLTPQVSNPTQPPTTSVLQTALYIGSPLVSALTGLPPLPVGLTGTTFAPGEPMYPTIPKLPYLPQIGQLLPTINPGFGAVALATASRWGISA